jgi:23S rRNA pseudouridine2605 synthase
MQSEITVSENSRAPKLVRLQKYIADCGIASRRNAEAMIFQGRVELNGRIVTEMGTKVNPEIDSVIADGHPVSMAGVEKVYLLLHKPRCCVTTVKDPEGRPTVMDIVAHVHERIYPVGRLDYLSEGLIVMTNDGELANLIMHPKYNVIKVYEVKVFGAVTDELLRKLRYGIEIDGDFVKPKAVRVIKQLPTKTWLEFRIGEGKNREIRRICEGAGLTVDKLKRIAINGLTLEGIAPGKYHFMTKKQILNSIGLNADGTPATHTPTYQSPKKSIDVYRKGAQAFVAADDKMFHQFRRDTYYESVKLNNQKREELLAAQTTMQNSVE